MNVYEWVRYTVGLWLYEAFEEQQEQQLQPQRLLQLEGPEVQEQGSQEDVRQEDEIHSHNLRVYLFGIRINDVTKQALLVQI